MGSENPGADEQSKPPEEQTPFIRGHRVTGRAGNGRGCSVRVTQTVESEIFGGY